MNDSTNSTNSTNISNVIDDLQWRGLIAQSTDIDALREELSTPTVAYVGFDPTGPSLHAGHLVPLLILARLQRFGHTPILLAGGATGMIGDPRDVGERTMLSEDEVAGNVERIKGQLASFVTFEGDNAAIPANNIEWTSQMSVVEFLRDLDRKSVV